MPARVQIVLPCYNEAPRLEAHSFAAFAHAHPEIALLFVDDGSSDETPARLTRLAAHGDGIDALLLPQHVGKAGAVQRGMLAAIDRRPEIVGFWDADLSTPLSAVPEFVAILDANPHVDVVMGSRVKLLGRDVRRRAARHYLGRLFATAASLALGVGVYDTQCGAKLFRSTPVMGSVLRAPFRSTWIFDVEILARYIAAVGTQEAERRICEVPLHIWTDVPGSKLRARDAVRAAWDLARLVRR